MTSHNQLRDRTAIVGVGHTTYSRDSGVSTQTLALHAIQAAVQDAGISWSELNGVASHRVGDSVDPAQIAQALGITDLSYLIDVRGGGSTAAGTVIHAAMAIATGLADYIVCWRSLNSRSEARLGAFGTPAHTGDMQYWAPYRHTSPPQLFAMYSRPFMERWGYTAQDLGRVAIQQRLNAAHSPRAMKVEPFTMDEYLASRWIAEPLRLLDCCLETDGAVALILTSTERAKDLRQPVVTLRGAAFGGGNQLTSNGWSNLEDTPAERLAPRLYAAAGVGPADIDVAELYDAFTPLVLMQLAAYGLCEPGGAADMVAAGETRLDGRLPVNTHGGHLSEGYVHGLNHVAEAVEQMRGSCGTRQVAGAGLALVTSQPGIASGNCSAIVLRRD